MLNAWIAAQSCPNKNQNNIPTQELQQQPPLESNHQNMKNDDSNDKDKVVEAMMMTAHSATTPMAIEVLEYWEDQVIATNTKEEKEEESFACQPDMVTSSLTYVVAVM